MLPSQSPKPQDWHVPGGSVLQNHPAGAGSRLGPPSTDTQNALPACLSFPWGGKATLWGSAPSSIVPCFLWSFSKRFGFPGRIAAGSEFPSGCSSRAAPSPPRVPPQPSLQPGLSQPGVFVQQKKDVNEEEKTRETNEGWEKNMFSHPK